MTGTTITPYLFFGGRCEEALEFYRKALGAEVEMLMRFDESPQPPPPGVLPAGFETRPECRWQCQTTLGVELAFVPANEHRAASLAVACLRWFGTAIRCHERPASPTAPTVNPSGPHSQPFLPTSRPNARVWAPVLGQCATERASNADKSDDGSGWQRRDQGRRQRVGGQGHARGHVGQVGGGGAWWGQERHEGGRVPRQRGGALEAGAVSGAPLRDADHLAVEQRDLAGAQAREADP